MGSPAKSAAVACILWACGTSLATAQIVVLNARGPSAAAYPQGAVLPPNRTLLLKAGDRLEILDAAGSHVLNGPASLTAGQISSGPRTGLQDIFQRANASRPGIAAVRGFSLTEASPPPPPPEAPPLWRLDVTAWQQAEPMDTHNFCVVAGQTPILTRTPENTTGTLVIYDEATQVTHTLTWPAGVRDLAWPSDLPFAAGGAYDINLDATGATKVRWRTVAPGASSLTELASNLLDKACYDQLDTLQTEFAAK